jgi:hypothetical protein
MAAFDVQSHDLLPDFLGINASAGALECMFGLPHQSNELQGIHLPDLPYADPYECGAFRQDGIPIRELCVLQLSSKGKLSMGRAGWVLLSLAVLTVCGNARQPDGRRIAVAVSYVTSQTVYLDGGKNHAIAPGDTGTLFRRGIPSGRVVVTGVSSSSSSARLLPPADSVAVGDSVVFAMTFRERTVARGNPDSLSQAQRVREVVKASPALVHGRVGLQYTAMGEAGGPMAYSRPSLLMYFAGTPFGGSNIAVNLHARVDGSLGSPSGYWASKGTTLRVYDLSVTLDDPRQWYGFSAGRVASAYVGGLGLFDGVQVLVRGGALTVGGVGGFQPDYRTSGFNNQTQKLAGFISIAWPASASLRGSSTLAYGQQLFRGALDRDFLFLQNTMSLSTSLFLYQSTEVDLHRRDGDGRKGTFSLTNTYLSVTYQPLDWLGMNLGYDATRRIEFLQSEKNLLDSLLDRDLRQGWRGSVNFRLPLNVNWQVLGGYRLPAGGQSAGYSAGSGLRIADIGGLGVSADGQVIRIRSPYTDGNDITAGVDYMPVGSVTIGAHWDQYAFTTRGSTDDSRTIISTVTGSVSWYVSRGWYLSVFADRVRDSDRVLYRGFAEFGYHF